DLTNEERRQREDAELAEVQATIDRLLKVVGLDEDDPPQASAGSGATPEAEQRNADSQRPPGNWRPSPRRSPSPAVRVVTSSLYSDRREGDDAGDENGDDDWGYWRADGSRTSSWRRTEDRRLPPAFPSSTARRWFGASSGKTSKQKKSKKKKDAAPTARQQKKAERAIERRLAKMSRSSGSALARPKLPGRPPEMPKKLYSTRIGRTIERGDLNSSELRDEMLHAAQQVLGGKYWRDPDLVVTGEEDFSSGSICMSAAVPKLDVKVKIPVTPQLHALPEGRALVRQFLSAIALLRLQAQELATAAAAPPEVSRAEKYRQPAPSKAANSNKRQVPAASTGRVSAMDELKEQVVRALEVRSMTIQDLSSQFGPRLKELSSNPKKTKFCNWLNEISGVVVPMKGGHPDNKARVIFRSNRSTRPRRRERSASPPRTWEGAAPQALPSASLSSIGTDLRGVWALPAPLLPPLAPSYGPLTPEEGSRQIT
ncbi:unnamed protein product, partial [Symbiodinium pilosum]